MSSGPPIRRPGESDEEFFLRHRLAIPDQEPLVADRHGELAFDAVITGVGDMPGHGPSIVVRPSCRKPSILPVPGGELKAWGARIGERVRVRMLIMPSER